MMNLHIRPPLGPSLMAGALAPRHAPGFFYRPRASAADPRYLPALAPGAAHYAPHRVEQSRPVTEQAASLPGICVGAAVIALPWIAVMGAYTFGQRFAVKGCGFWLAAHPARALFGAAGWLCLAAWTCMRDGRMMAVRVSGQR